MSMLEHRCSEADARPTRTKIELIATKRAIAIGKLTEFERQCARLTQLIAEGVIGLADAADGLFDAADANGLIEAHGQDCLSAWACDDVIVGRAIAAGEMNSCTDENEQPWNICVLALANTDRNTIHSPPIAMVKSSGSVGPTIGQAPRVNAQPFVVGTVADFTT